MVAENNRCAEAAAGKDTAALDVDSGLDMGLKRSPTCVHGVVGHRLTVRRTAHKPEHWKFEAVHFRYRSSQHLPDHSISKDRCCLAAGEGYSRPMNAGCKCLKGDPQACDRNI